MEAHSSGVCQLTADWLGQKFLTKNILSEKFYFTSKVMDVSMHLPFQSLTFDTLSIPGPAALGWDATVIWNGASLKVGWGIPTL